MNDSRWTWRGIGMVSLAASLLLAIGFIYAVRDIVNPRGDAFPAAEEAPRASAPAASDEYRIVALGDSLAKGTGDSDGKGFARRAVEELTEQGVKARLLANLGINGLTTAGLQDRLQDEGFRYAVRQANVILVSIGGNDLFQGSGVSGGDVSALAGSAGASGAPSASPAPGTGAASAGSPAVSAPPAAAPAPFAPSDELDPKELLAALPAASERLRSTLDTLTELNPQASVYYVGLYNPFGDIPQLLKPGNQAVTAWNYAVSELANQHPAVTLVPTLDLFSGRQAEYLANDHFHPNGDGYQRIADRIVQAIR